MKRRARIAGSYVAIVFGLLFLISCPFLPDTSFGTDIPWFADHETGDLTQWYFPDTKEGNNGGGIYNSGISDAVASREQAHTGAWSAKMTITTPPVSGTRLFRWAESQKYPELYYSVWFYFPQRYSAPNWWNVFQWKSKTVTKNDPFFNLVVGNRPDGRMFFYLWNGEGRVSYTQSAKDIPIGKWFQVEAFYRCTGDQAGQVTFWQDGTLLFNVENVQTRYADGDCQWSVNNYSESVTPSPATIYVDDCAISTERIAFFENPDRNPPSVSTGLRITNRSLAVE